jgi:succinate dehydrogenase/fumarate reductase flavoprotein subunit
MEDARMSTWHEYLQSGKPIPPWPYPVRYGQEKQLSTDVLVFGGGIAGSHAAISARQAGAKVLVVEKEATKWSGNGGAGVDHWLSACTNPCSTVSPEEYTERVLADCGGYDCGPLRYVVARESYDALLDVEKMGVRVRDEKGEFEGADFRDPKTGLLFAYDYVNRCEIRVWGWNMKPSLYGEMRSLGVEILDRVMVTSFLTEGEGESRRVVGVTGLDTRTGEFYVIRAKATILATGLPGRVWNFSTEYRSTFRDPNVTAEGVSAAWRAGVELARIEESYQDSGTLAYISYAVGCAHNTWHGCPIVDANGKEIPWVDRDGKELGSLEDRFRPSPGQRFMLGDGLRVPGSYENQTKKLAPDLPERIRKGEFVLPLYADLSRMPERERRAIFGLMVGNEGRTRIPVYETLTKAGFDPEQDMLQVPVMDPSAYCHSNFWAGVGAPQWRMWGCGGVVVDWDLRTNLEGLYAAGGAIFGAGAHSSAAASGRFAGRRAANYALGASEPKVDAAQAEREKARVYAPLKPEGRPMGWKELNAGIGRVMQDYCGQYKSELTLKEGLRVLGEVRESEAASVAAANPHELTRAVECLGMLDLGEAVMHASLARRSSSEYLEFHRIDYPAVDPPEWRKLLPIKLGPKGPETRELPFDYFLKAPNAPTMEANYLAHGGVAKGGER